MWGRESTSRQQSPSESQRDTHTLVAFDSNADPCVPDAFTSQSVIGEIKPLTIVMPGQGHAFAAGAPALCCENTLRTIFRQFCKTFHDQTKSSAWAATAHPTGPFDHHSISS